MAEKGEPAYYLALRRKAIERSRQRRGEDGPLTEVVACRSCGHAVRVMKDAAPLCVYCETGVPRPA